VEVNRGLRAAGWYSIGVNLLSLALLACAIFAFAHLRAHIVENGRMATFAFAQHDELLQMVNEETGVRGYVATGDPSFLDIYVEARAAYAGDVAQERRAGTPAIAGAIARSSSLSLRLQSYFLDEIALVRNGRRSQAVADLSQGKRLFDRMRQIDRVVQARATDDRLAGRARTLELIDATIRIAIVLFVLVALALVTFLRLKQRFRATNESAFQDPLTGLGNRRLAVSGLQRLLGKPKEQAPVGLLYIDLDGFKKINDTYGHECGDAVLREVAQRLKRELRAEDVISRIGGDEFVCVVARPASPAQLQSIAERVHHRLTRPYAVFDQDFVVGCSIGWSVSSEHGADPQVLLSRADQAMYDAKTSGGGVRSASVRREFVPAH
jgi:diguanylate cyclase (GGDEF)-like protein